MTNINRTALTILTALIATAPMLAQAQTTPAKPADTMKSDTMMKAAPTFAFSKDAGMNMMMSGNAVDITAAPGEKLITKSISGQSATLVYSGKNSQAIFNFYDKAIKSEGWKTTAMDGKMMADGKMVDGKMADDKMKAGDTMTKPDDKMKAGDTMAKTGDTMKADDKMKAGDTMAKSGAMMSGVHSATFANGGHSIDLVVRESAGRVTVTFKSK
jgi:hypothetical protein